jgi:hypothetical protein
MGLDADDLDEAIASAAWQPIRGGPQTASDAQIARLRGAVARLVIILPGEMTVHEMRGLLRLEAEEDCDAPPI